jgi:TPR repeat protein
MGLRSRFVLGCLTLAFGLASPLAGRAQSIPSEYLRFFALRTDQRSRFEKALNLVGNTKFPVGRSFALIAGVTEYPNFRPMERSLTPAKVDIEKLQAYLKEQEFFDEVVVLKDGDMTLPNLNYFLENYFPEHLGQSPHSRFLLAYSGHGYSVKAGETTRGYLLTSPATSLTDPVNRLDLDVLRSMLGPVIDSAEKVMVLINSCDSGAFLGSSAFGPSPFSPGDKGAHAIMASKSNQQSLHLDALGPGSVFFEEIFAGLGGAADKAPADGVVTYHELDTYLHGEIPYATRGNQNPVEGDLLWPHHSVGEFFFLNRSRQLSLGNAPVWNPKDAVAFGVPAEDVLRRGREAYDAKRYPEAIGLFTQAAASGNAAAMFRLGYMYSDGEGVTQDYQQARQWWEKGAATGSAAATYDLGTLYAHGHGVTQDYQQARQWFEKAAAAGEAAAMDALGGLYTRGLGVTQDYQQARQWFEKGAAAGSRSAMYNLGSEYYFGHGVTRDYQQARQWYEKAAAAGDAAAMDSLGLLYEYGLGVPRDYQQARQWYEKAAAAGDRDAQERLKSLHLRLLKLLSQ